MHTPDNIVNAVQADKVARNNGVCSHCGLEFLVLFSLGRARGYVESDGFFTGTNWTAGTRPWDPDIALLEPTCPY